MLCVFSVISYTYPSMLKEVFKRIKKEAELWNTLKHENITPIIGFAHCESEFRGVPLIMCKFFEEGDLKWYMKNHPNKLDVLTKLSLVRQRKYCVFYNVYQRTYSLPMSHLL